MAGTSKQLICAACGQVIATASWRTFKALEITTPDGVRWRRSAMTFAADRAAAPGARCWAGSAGSPAPGRQDSTAMPATGSATSDAGRVMTR
jgi:hypothetical protein